MSNDGGVTQETVTPYRSTQRLQVVTEASSDYMAGSSDPLRSHKVQGFYFSGLAGRFETALEQSPGLTLWSVNQALMDFHNGGADDAAFGGDLAYHYALRGGFSNAGLDRVSAVLTDQNFGAAAHSRPGERSIIARTLRAPGRR